MKTLADELLDALPVLMVSEPTGPDAPALAAFLAAPVARVREAMERLETDSRARVVRYAGSKRRHLVPLGYRPFGMVICARCGLAFELPRKSKRNCCSRACSISWSWTRPGTAERRISAIKAVRATPEGRARLAEHNRRRWSRPEEHERLSEQNRREWADPVKSAKRSAAIQAVHGRPENRQFYSDLRKQMWSDPEYRERAVESMRRSKSAPEAKAKFSKLLSDRWQDPETRPKYLAAVRKAAAIRGAQMKGRKQSPEHVAKRMASIARSRAAKVTAGIE